MLSIETGEIHVLSDETLILKVVHGKFKSLALGKARDVGKPVAVFCFGVLTNAPDFVLYGKSQRVVPEASLPFVHHLSLALRVKALHKLPLSFNLNNKFFLVVQRGV